MSDFPFTQIVSTKEMARTEIETVLQLSQEMEKILAKKEERNSLQGKIVASLFYEPSTRTRLSFETAVLRLGGKIINAVGAENSSFKKGETLYDTIKTIENYADIIVMRHVSQKATEEAIRATQKPFLNAGNGAGEHPTQALLDAYTIYKEQHQIDGLTIGVSGDLKNGRTVHSLVYLLSKFQVKFVFIAPNKLALPKEVKSFLKENKVSFVEVNNLEEVIENLDVLYVTRIQKERFENLSEYEELKEVYCVTSALISNGKQNLSVMHPLPRVSEIAPEVDDLPQAVYFKQVQNSVPVRMALLELVAGR